jgi:4,5-dihydroxyphthalate decarboxylase
VAIQVITNIRYASSVLASGRVKVKGFDVEFTPHPTPNVTAVFNDMVQKLAYDAVDIPFSNYIIARDLGKPLTAIPAFPTMFCPLLGPMVNRKSGIKTVDDLVGKRVGVSGLAFNPAVWVRSIFLHYYDLPFEKIVWVEGEPNSMSSVPFPRSRRFTVEKGGNLMQMLRDGQIDCFLMSDGGVEPDDLIDRIFQDPIAEIRKYVDSTGFVPINSVITIKEDVLKANPGLDRALTEAYEEAWEIYIAESAPSDKHMMLPIGDFRSEGLLPPPHGFRANRKNIRTMIASLYEQSLIRTLFEPEDLFAITD